MPKLAVVSIALLAILSACWTTPALGGGTRTVGIIPDPSCRSSKLVVPVEQTLADNLHAPRLKVVKKDPGSARLLLRYVLRVHPKAGQVVVQLDGEVFTRRSDKLMAEGSVRSDAFSDDDAGRTEAARQAGRRLGQMLSDGLVASLSRPARGRRVMLQINLRGEAVAKRPAVEASLKRALRSMSLRSRGSTERNLMMTLFTTERTKDMVELVEKAIAAAPDVKLKWLVKSDNTLMLELTGAGR